MKKYLYTSGLEEEQYHSIKNAIYEENREKLKIFSLLGMILFGIMILISFVSSTMAGNRISYIWGLVCSSILFLLEKFYDKKNDFVMPSVYLYMTLLLGIGLQLGVIITPDEKAVTFISLLLLGPVVFTDRPIRMISYIACACIVFMIAVLKVKTGSVLEADLVHICIYSVLSMTASTYMTVMKCERYFAERELRRFSRTDVLTGLYNRNAFTEYTDKYEIEKMPKNFTIIYFDVNDLKSANDVLGHDAGDELIKAAANCIKDTFGNIGKCYRTGGDEFIVIIEVIEKEVFRLCQLFEKKIDSWTGKKVKKLHVSYGYASVEEFPEANFLNLQKCADERLYHNKRAFYSIKGNDRRGQKHIF